MLVSFFEFVEAELDRSGFFRPVGKRPVMARNFRNIIHRLQPTVQDIRTLRGAIVRLIEGPRVLRTVSRRGNPLLKVEEAPGTPPDSTD